MKGKHTFASSGACPGFFFFSFFSFHLGLKIKAELKQMWGQYIQDDCRRIIEVNKASLFLLMIVLFDQQLDHTGLLSMSVQDCRHFVMYCSTGFFPKIGIEFLFP